MSNLFVLKLISRVFTALCLKSQYIAGRSFVLLKVHFIHAIQIRHSKQAGYHAMPCTMCVGSSVQNHFFSPVCAKEMPEDKDPPACLHRRRTIELGKWWKCCCCCLDQTGMLDFRETKSSSFPFLGCFLARLNLEAKYDGKIERFTEIPDQLSPECMMSNYKNKIVEKILSTELRNSSWLADWLTN